jgi:hypothetical protein
MLVFISFLVCNIILFLSINKYVQVSISWLKDRPKAYWALCKLWSSPEFITKSKRARQCRGSTGGHTFGPDGHICLAKCMVRKIYTKIYLEYIYSTNSYPQERETCVQLSGVQVFVRVIDHVTLHKLVSYALSWRQLDL